MKRILLLIGALLFGLAVRAQSVTYTCRYWFDQDFAQAATTTFSNSTWQAELDVGLLSEGLHTLHLHVMDTSMQWSAPQNYLFLKTNMAGQGGDNYVYHYWFDQDFEQQQSDALGTGHLLLDVADLEDGIHTLNVMLQGSTLTATQSYVFLKIAVEDPSTELQYHCWFDQDYENVQTGLLGSGLFELEISDLPNGIHTVNVQLDNGTRTAPQCYLFYKQPLGGYGIARWEYWLNDDVANRQITNISPFIDTLDIISLLNVGHPAIRSNCFHFHPNGDAPYINAKNQISFQFYDSELHLINKSAFYVDEQVEQDIVAEVFEHNTTETFNAPRNNQIQWFKLDAVIGDSLAFKADKACSIQLFAPSGEEVYNVSGPGSVMFCGLHAWEDGTYYLAVHDVTGSGDQISVTYQYVHKYAVLAYDVHLVGNGGRSTITFQGNGFINLLDVYLVNAQNDTIRPMNIGHESNTTTSVTFDFNEVNLGMYDAVFQFYDETIQINGALEVQEPVDIVLTASGFYLSQFLRNSPCTCTFQITNHGNMTAYDVPVVFYIYTIDSTSITRVDIDGFDVKSNIIRLLGSHYTDSLDNVIEQKRLISGDLFDFLEASNSEYVPDAPYLLYNSITPTLRPNTTKTFTISMRSANMVSIYMCYPDEWENVDSIENLTKYDAKICGPYLKDIDECIENGRAKRYEKYGESIPYPNAHCDPVPAPIEGCPLTPDGPMWPVNPFDPNDIHGYLSESGSHYMRQEIQNVQYEIEFENDTTLATAAAHTIIVRDTLDATKFDLNSLAARSVTIGDKRLDLNGEQTFARTLDLRPELYVIAQVEQDYDPTTGIIQWTIQSLDPMTMEPTNDPNQGVLPVNYYGNGVGFIDYSINLKQAFADGTAISNRAGIIFDQEEVIMTPTWTNIVDAVKPTSYIEEVTFEADTLNFSFVSSDNRSGVWYRSLYYRNEATDQDWKVKVPKIVENSYSLHFDEYLTTEYLVMAVDSAGNVEEKDMTAEYVHYYDGPGPVTQVSTLSQGWNWWSTYVEMDNADGLSTFEESLGQNGSIIKSQDAFVQYGDQANNSGVWAGTLVAIDNESSYKVKVEAACTSVMSGAVAVPQNHPMTLTSGWNWIGYPVSTPQAVVSALSGFEPASGDVIKGQGDFITYDESYGWIPASFVLNPGKGYQYYSNASTNKTLVFTQSRGTVLPAASKKCHWQANRYAYPDNLSIMASVFVDGEELRDDNVELGAFVNGECRGSAKLNYVEPLGRHLAFLTVTGKDGDQVEFRLMDQSNAPAIMSVDYITFHSNAIIGNLGAPLPIRFGAMNGMTEMKTDMEVYPNPVDCNTPFTLMIPEGETVAEVLVVNALGDVVSHEAGQMTHSMRHGLPSAGVYMVKVTCKSGNVYLSRVVVK